MRGSDRPDAVAPALGAALDDDDVPAVPEPLPLEVPCEGAGVELPEDPLLPLPECDLLPLLGPASGSVYWLSPALWASAAAGGVTAQATTARMTAIRFIEPVFVADAGPTTAAASTIAAVAGDDRRLSEADERELRELLLRWDPIGVVHEPDWPQDEYDGLLGPLAERLRAGATERELAAFLETAVREHLGLEPDPEREAGLARDLAGWHARANAPDP